MNYILKSRLSELPSTNDVHLNDLFVISKYKQDDELPTYDSVNVTFNEVFSEILKNLCNLSSFNPIGKFDFTLSTSIPMISEENIEKFDLSSVVSIGYAEKVFLSAVTDLSSKLYGNDMENYPSYVGQIIMGDELSSESEIQKIYGESTRWKQIQGRFLLGNGIVGKNTMSEYGNIQNESLNFNNKKLGGEHETKVEFAPPHSHKFKDANYKRFPSLSVSFDVKTEDVFTTIKAYTGNRRPHYQRHGGEGDYVTAINPDVYLGSTRESKTFSFKADGTITENVSEENPHNNMPPYYVTYIWERIS